MLNHNKLNACVESNLNSISVQLHHGEDLLQLVQDGNRHLAACMRREIVTVHLTELCNVRLVYINK